VRRLKDLHILRVFSAADMRKLTKNGGVSVTCGDGDIDVSRWHSYAISDRPHEVKSFAGTLNACKEYRGYDPEEESVMVKNIAKGFYAKDTWTLFLEHHFPCGMAGFYNHTIEEVLYYAYLVSMRFRGDLGTKISKRLLEIFSIEGVLREDRIFDFFHVKWINKAKREEQSMYVFDPDLYAEYFIKPQAEFGHF